jgi:hypothetical protein
MTHSGRQSLIFPILRVNPRALVYVNESDSGAVVRGSAVRGNVCPDARQTRVQVEPMHPWRGMTSGSPIVLGHGARERKRSYSWELLHALWQIVLTHSFPAENVDLFPAGNDADAAR